ncbi:unknown [Prevotella sp. CAG:873]|nr:unknown [Prevotella sp. CAG:873]
MPGMMTLNTRTGTVLQKPQMYTAKATVSRSPRVSPWPINSIPDSSTEAKTPTLMRAADRWRYNSRMVHTNVATSNMAYISTPPLNGIPTILTKNSSNS